MKQHAITGLKSKLRLVELPEGANRVSVFHDIGHPYISYFIKDGDTERLYLKEDVELIGKLTDIKEEQHQQWVDKFNNGIFRDYKDKYPFAPDCDINYFFITAKESFFSKLETDGIYFVNKIKKPTVKESSGTIDLSLKLDAYYKAESEVWDINRCWIFEVI